MSRDSDNTTDVTSEQAEDAVRTLLRWAGEEVTAGLPAGNV